MKLLFIITALFSSDTLTITTTIAFSGGPKTYEVYESRNTCYVTGDQVEITFGDLEPMVFTFSRRRKIRHLNTTWFKIEGEGQTEYFTYTPSGFAFYDPRTKAMDTYLNR